MHRKLTITVDEAIYRGLRKKIGPRKISQFIEDLVRPHVLTDLNAAYAEMARDESSERDAREFIEGVAEDFEA